MKKWIVIISSYLIFIVITFGVLSKSFGVNLILNSFGGNSALLSSRLLISLAMPSIKGPWGNLDYIAKEDWNEYFYYKQGKTIAEEKGHSDEFAALLAEILQNEEFEPTEGYSVIKENLHPKGDGGATYTKWENVYIRNQSEQTPDTESLMREKLSLNFEGEEGPLVLIYHTHTTEGYNTTGENYTSGSPTHSTDNEKNMVAVGETFKQALEALGIESVHCTERLDTTYDDAYDNSYETIKEYLEQYPSIKIVVDMHRDSIIDSENNKYRPVTQIQGIEAAQIMFVVGMSTYTENEFVEENLSFALNLANTLEKSYPEITRSVMLKNSTFNQELCPNSILVEMGATGNTLTEAKRSAAFLASAVAGLLFENGYKGE